MAKKPRKLSKPRDMNFTSARFRKAGPMKDRRTKREKSKLDKELKNAVYDEE